jgi:hypothetical protein
MTAIRNRDIPVALPMKRKRTMRRAPQMWLRRPAAGRLGGVSPPVFSPQVDTFPPQPYSRSRSHTDAIQNTLIPPSITKAQATVVYASEANLLNVAIFGRTAKQWRGSPVGPYRRARPTCRHRRVWRLKPPMPAPLEQLVVLTNLERLNSVLIRQGLPQPDRLATLNTIASTQMRTRLAAGSVTSLK